ncbi:RNA methyltransferase [Sanguibacter sp. HDW7]|uniref:TrmH family RNA methyltransferase n=1 Tax=Sanguibacter sp. HDW7 TaxID=2714931 RepID=UPI001407E81F|nr:RNA methyltransferase [Sanguibacter sp. HDW7]QIK83339.1 RNA methyltransferase [Sanguibacter sp. HDW7]
MPDLSNPRAERVRGIRALSGRPARSRAGRYLVEGPQGVREAVLHARDDVREVYLTEAAAERYAEIVDACDGLWLRTGTPEVLEAMSPDAQGVLAVLEPRPSSLDALLERGPRLVAVLVEARDPGNAGTVIRAVDAAGGDGVVLAGSSVDPHNPKVVRSTAGSLFHVPVVAGDDARALEDVVVRLRAAGLQVLAADGTGEHDLDDLLDVAGTAPAGRPDLAAPTAWVFGNEARGLTDEQRALADHVVRAPLRGRAESLNLAMAATVCLYGSARAQRARRG